MGWGHASNHWRNHWRGCRYRPWRILLWLPICRHRCHRAHRRSTFRRCCRSTTGPASILASMAAGAYRQRLRRLSRHDRLSERQWRRGRRHARRQFPVRRLCVRRRRRLGLFRNQYRHDLEASVPSAAIARPATIGWRRRAGYAADRVLLYATAGGAFANVQTNFNGTTTSHTQSGWTAGAGIEWAFADNWTAKVEYLYVNLGNGSVTCVSPTCLAFAGVLQFPSASD